jgi:hypothetical protein
METINKQAWIFPANINIIDIYKAFCELGQIDWKCSSRASVGDTVYIYFSSPIKKIVLATQVIDTDVKELTKSHLQSYFHYDRYFQEYQNKRGRYIRLKLLRELSEKESNCLTFDCIKKNGLKTVSIRNAILINNNKKLSMYFEKVIK